MGDEFVISQEETMPNYTITQRKRKDFMWDYRFSKDECSEGEVTDTLYVEAELISAIKDGTA